MAAQSTQRKSEKRKQQLTAHDRHCFDYHTQPAPFLRSAPAESPPGRSKSTAQNSRSARRRLPAVPMFASVKLNRYAFSFRTDPSSYFRYSTASPQQFQL